MALYHEQLKCMCHECSFQCVNKFAEYLLISMIQISYPDLSWSISQDHILSKEPCMYVSQI